MDMIEGFKLEPGDILVNVNDRGDPYSRLKRWCVGPGDHVFLYLGKVGIIISQRQRKILRVPMLCESNGRGVVIQALSNRYGQKVVVMRLNSERNRRRIEWVLQEAIKLASDPQARYDYSVITTHIIPKLILEKLHLPIPLRYHRDRLMICSELVGEVFWRARIEIVPRNVVPLPGDFLNSSLLEKVQRGDLSAEMV